MGGFGEFTPPQYGDVDGSLEWNSPSFHFQLMLAPHGSGNSQMG
jgi:hypothetical protein